MLQQLDAELVKMKGNQVSVNTKNKRAWKQKAIERQTVELSEDIEANPIIDTIYKELKMGR